MPYRARIHAYTVALCITFGTDTLEAFCHHLSSHADPSYRQTLLCTTEQTSVCVTGQAGAR
jgi:hypothetical protein